MTVTGPNPACVVPRDSSGEAVHWAEFKGSWFASPAGIRRRWWTSLPRSVAMPRVSGGFYGPIWCRRGCAMSSQAAWSQGCVEWRLLWIRVASSQAAAGWHSSGAGESTLND